MKSKNNNSKKFNFDLPVPKDQIFSSVPLSSLRDDILELIAFDMKYTEYNPNFSYKEQRFAFIANFNTTDPISNNSTIVRSIAAEVVEKHISMPHFQNMNINATSPSSEPIVFSNQELSLKFLAIPYQKFHSADPELWDGITDTISIFGDNTYFATNVQNVISSFYRISTFIQQ